MSSLQVNDLINNSLNPPRQQGSLHACKLDNTGNCISGDVIPRIVQLASMRIAQELCACHGNSVVGPGVHYVALGELLHHV